jgi:hypothetical protein
MVIFPYDVNVTEAPETGSQSQLTSSVPAEFILMLPTALMAATFSAGPLLLIYTGP